MARPHEDALSHAIDHIRRASQWLDMAARDRNIADGIDHIDAAQHVAEPLARELEALLESVTSETDVPAMAAE